MFRLGTQDKDFLPIGLVEKFETLRSLGFDGFEIDGKTLVERFGEVKAAIASTRFQVFSVCGGYRGWIGDFDEVRREYALCDIEIILEKAGEIGASGIVVPAAWGMFSKRLPPMTPPRSDVDDRAVLLDSLARLERVSARTGTRVHFEPLNRYEDHMVNTVDQALAIIDKGGFDRVSVLPDFFHMNIEEADIAQTLHDTAGRYSQVHLASSQRFQPGTGHLDLVSAFGALASTGFDGCGIFECRVLGNNPMEAYRRSVRFVRDAADKAGLA